jgi:hypothetical protein
VAHLKVAPRTEEAEGSAVSLRYVARAGLVRELSAQTYDAFWKALREAILNAIDADASRVDIYLPEQGNAIEVIVEDDGSGMDLRALSEHFLSVGGSARVGDSTKFGRIGIGSLALLQYGDGVTIETKRAGSSHYCVAELHHGEWLERASRRDLLGDISAGTAREVAYDGDSGDHFTRIRLKEPNLAAQEAGMDPTVRAQLTDQLRRVLPLPWPSNRLTESLAEIDGDLVRDLAEHADRQSAEIVLHGAWDDGVVLSRRQFGEREGVGEDWTGPLWPIHKSLKIPTPEGPPRTVVVAGYLLNQTHASVAWSGLTARVQNVAVEENTFFDVIADPGFRKYISGEVYFLGDVDRERLINIDRASFNRECQDYAVAQAYIVEVLQRFKVQHVQQPQRLKVSARKLIQEHSRRLAAIQRVVELDGSEKNLEQAGLPSSGRSLKNYSRCSLDDALKDIGCVVGDTTEFTPTVIVDNGGSVVCDLPDEWSHPTVTLRGKSYRVAFGESAETDLPVVIRNKPREIAFNLLHPAHHGKSPEAMARTLGLEIAYLHSGDGDTEELFERLLSFLAVA